MNKEDQIRELRSENDNLIHEQKKYGIDWIRFKHLVEAIPPNLDKSKKKTALQTKDRLKFEMRDKGVCYICDSIFHYGSCNVFLYTHSDYKLSHLHHIIPTGGIEDDNIVTLCTHCHQMVHQALYISGAWKYARPL
jgi:hypothetical protein